MVNHAIHRAEKVIPLAQPGDAENKAQWQSIIKVGEFIETNPQEVWDFTLKWGKHPISDIRAAVATCLLEHLLEFHFDTYFPQVKRATLKSKRLADTFMRSSKFGQAKIPKNAAAFDKLEKKLFKESYHRPISEKALLRFEKSIKGLFD